MAHVSSNIQKAKYEMHKKRLLHVASGGAHILGRHGFNPDDWQEIRLDIEPAVQPDIIGSMTDMPNVADNSVDAIFFSHNPEHLVPHELPVALGEFLRVLKDDGYLAATLPDAQQIEEVLTHAGFGSLAIKRGNDHTIYAIASKPKLTSEALLELFNKHWGNAGNNGSAQNPQNGAINPSQPASTAGNPQRAASIPAYQISVPQNPQTPSFITPYFWGPKNHEVFMDLLKIASKQVTCVFCSDNLFTINRCNSMLHDSDFMKAWASNCVCGSDQAIIWRRYIMCMAAYHCAHLEGDFVEAGAYQGTGSKTVIDYLAATLPEIAAYKTFWLYDLFEHPEGALNHAMPAHGPNLDAQVCNRFKGYSNVRIFKGEIPAIFAEGAPEKICWLHIDLNQAPAEMAVLEALFDKIVPGGIVIFDDYEFLAYKAQKDAQDPWLAERGYKVFPLPTGQGLVIKR